MIHSCHVSHLVLATLLPKLLKSIPSHLCVITTTTSSHLGLCHDFLRPLVSSLLLLSLLSTHNTVIFLKDRKITKYLLIYF
jgi:hypothetical protein